MENSQPVTQAEAPSGFVSELRESRRLKLTTAAGIIIGGLLVWRFWTTLFGPGTWGSGGNMVAWVICGAISFTWLHFQEKARHLAQLALARQHHQEQMDQAISHHEQQMEQASRHHDILTRRLEGSG